jgi:hypothetical protein
MNKTKITFFDLKKYKYTIQELEDNINNLEIKHILHYQILNADFCAKYVLNERYASCMEDIYLIDIGYVLYHQPHITKEELLEKVKQNSEQNSEKSSKQNSK